MSLVSTLATGGSTIGGYDDEIPGFNTQLGIEPKESYSDSVDCTGLVTDVRNFFKYSIAALKSLVSELLDEEPKEEEHEEICPSGQLFIENIPRNAGLGNRAIQEAKEKARSKRQARNRAALRAKSEGQRRDAATAVSKAKTTATAKTKRNVRSASRGETSSKGTDSAKSLGRSIATMKGRFPNPFKGKPKKKDTPPPLPPTHDPIFSRKNASPAVKEILRGRKPMPEPTLNATSRSQESSDNHPSVRFDEHAKPAQRKPNDNSKALRPKSPTSRSRQSMNGHNGTQQLNRQSAKEPSRKVQRPSNGMPEPPRRGRRPTGSSPEISRKSRRPQSASPDPPRRTRQTRAQDDSRRASSPGPSLKRPAKYSREIPVRSSREMLRSTSDELRDPPTKPKVLGFSKPAPLPKSVANPARMSRSNKPLPKEMMPKGFRGFSRPVKEKVGVMA